MGDENTLQKSKTSFVKDLLLRQHKTQQDIIRKDNNMHGFMQNFLKT